MLQGLPEYQTDEMPTWALDMSDSLMPVAYSMAWDAPCDFGCVMYLLIELSSLSAFAVRRVELVNARLWICEYRARCNNQFDIFLTVFDVAIVSCILHAEARLQGVGASSFFWVDCSSARSELWKLQFIAVVVLAVIAVSASFPSRVC